MFLEDQSYKIFQISHTATAEELVSAILEKNHLDVSRREEWSLYEVEEGGG